MKPESQRIAIAEARGFQWKFAYKSTSVGDELTEQRVLTKKDAYHRSLYEAHAGDSIIGSDVPNYPADMNAMHAAEKVLGYKHRKEHPGILFDAVCRTADATQRDFNAVHPDAWAIYATASQRAEAFLRTLGLWRDDE